MSKVQLSYALSILVFLIHISTFANYTQDETFISGLNTIVDHLKTSISQVAVPLFFILSGFVFYREYTQDKFVSKLKRRIKTLVVPYICWNIVGMLFSIVATLFFSKYFIGRQPFEFTNESVFQSVFFYKENRVFWFIFDLILFTLFTPLIFILIKNKVIGVLSIVTIWGLYGINIQLPLSIFFRSDSIIYYLFGAYLGLHYFQQISCMKFEKSFERIVLIFMLLVANIWLYLFYDTGYEMSFVSGEWMSVLIKIVYSISLFCIFIQYPTRIPYNSFMRNSFWVYALHINISAIITKIIWIILPQTVMAIPNFCLTIIITLIVIEFLSRITQKISPILYGMLSGGR